MPTVDTYRTNDGRAYFTFCFVDEGPYWRVDIERMPSFGGRNSGLHDTHRLPSSAASTGHKICFDDPYEAHSLEKAQKFSEAWAEAVWEWIKTGRRINGF
jgi:hypothetical protein